MYLRRKKKKNKEVKTTALKQNPSDDPLNLCLNSLYLNSVTKKDKKKVKCEESEKKEGKKKVKKEEMWKQKEEKDIFSSTLCCWRLQQTGGGEKK